MKEAGKMSSHGEEENDLAHILEAKRHHESAEDTAVMKEALEQMREDSVVQEAEIQVLKEKQVCKSAISESLPHTARSTWCL